MNKKEEKADLFNFLKISRELDIILIETAGVIYFNAVLAFDPVYTRVIKRLDIRTHRFWPVTSTYWKIENRKNYQAESKYFLAQRRGDLPEGCSLEEYIANPRLRLIGDNPLEGRRVLLFDDVVSTGYTLRSCVQDISHLGVSISQIFYHDASRICPWKGSIYEKEN